MKSKRKVGVLLALLMLMQCMAGCGKQTEDDSAYLNDVDPPQEITEEMKAEVGSDFSKMQQIASDGRLNFYMNMTTAEFCIEDTTSGEKYFSNPVNWQQDPSASEDNRNLMGSQIVVSYFGPDNNAGTMSSYKDSFLLGQLKTEKITNGVKVTYLLGTASSKRNFPQAIRTEEMEKLFRKMTDDQQKTVKQRYRFIEKAKVSDQVVNDTTLDFPEFKNLDSIYVLRTNLGKKVQDELEDIFIEIGYIYDDIDKEHEALGYVDESDLQASFEIPVEYKLDNGGFTAEILSGDIKYTKGFSLTQIQLLPYFVTADAERSGYFLVPDGSGALIDLNQSTTNGVIYTQSFYGDNPAITQTNKTQYANQVYMNVFGMKTDRSSVLGIVEEGAANGSLTVNVAGVYSSYNTIYTSFQPKASDFLSFDELGQGDGTYVFPLKTSKENYKVRYLFISDGNATYVDMASAYQEYLIEDGQLSDLTDEQSVPFFLELVGAIDKRETFIGIPYTKMTALTTFQQAQDIIDALLQQGIQNISLRYTGWANGGLNHSVYNGADPVSVLGGKNGFEELVRYTEEKQIDFYPDIELTRTYKDGLFDSFNARKHASRNINRQVATGSSIYQSTGGVALSNALQWYIITPAMYGEYLSSSLKDLEQWGVKNISLASIGTTVSADYNESRLIDRGAAFRMLQEMLDEQVDGKYGLLMDGCNIQLLQYASGLVNMPMSSSRFAIESDTVPFYQIAVHGYIPYAGEAINMAKDFDTNYLKAVETGAGLYVKWMYAENSEILDTKRTDLYSLSYQTWFDEIDRLYARYNQDMASVMNSRIVDHERLAEDVYRTVYENGVSTVVNYSHDAVDTLYGRVDAKDYIVVGEGGTAQ